MPEWLETAYRLYTGHTAARDTDREGVTQITQNYIKFSEIFNMNTSRDEHVNLNMTLKFDMNMKI